MLTPRQAAKLTRAILSSPAERWDRVVEAWAGRAWEALGYPSWAEWCEGELGDARLPVPASRRHLIISHLRDAGMSFEDVEALILRGGRAPASGRMAGTERSGSRLEDDLGFTPGELDLIGALLEVDDEEFGRVLAAGRRRGDLSSGWVRAACWDAVRRRRSVERDLERAARALARARTLLTRAEGSPATPAVRELLREVEDQAWDLLDEVDTVALRQDGTTVAEVPDRRPRRLERPQQP